MNKFVFVAALPVLLFEDISTTDLRKAWDISFVIFCFLATLLSILFSIAVSYRLKDRSIQGEFVQASYRSSAAILGIAFIQNIYGNSAISIHNENQILSQQEKTDHYKKDTNVSTFYDRNLSFPEIIIDLVGYGRVRHTNGQAYESTPLVCPARFGGRNFYELRPLNSLSANDESMGLGNEKANAIATVANTVFDYDFSNYNYASFYDLWTDETLPDNMATMRDILIDVFNAGKEGTHLPFGFFYNDEFAYTVVEQEDGSLALTEYSLYPSTAATVSTQSEDTSFDTPSYEVIDVEVADADHSVINIMYQ